MEKKLSQDSIARIDGAVQRFVAAWSDLKQAWAQLDTPQALDKAFYQFVDVWLATDRTVDQETHAHTLEYWNDPDLEIREILKGSARQAPSPSPAVDPPVIIVVCGDTRFKESFPEAVNRDEVFYSSLAAATQNLHLAAAALGLATTWGTVRKNAAAPLQGLLILPEQLEIVALVRVGYPHEIPPPRPRRSAGEAMHREKFDRTRLRNVETFIQTYGRGWGKL